MGRAEEILVAAACRDQAQGSLHDLSSAAAGISITWLEFIQCGLGVCCFSGFVSATVTLLPRLAEVC